jgi:hypothetical protein
LLKNYCTKILATNYWRFSVEEGSVILSYKRGDRWWSILFLEVIVREPDGSVEEEVTIEELQMEIK